MPEDWLDGLSEEWPSQPPSDADSASARSAPSSRSRIPQLRSSSGTYPSVRAKPASDSRRRSILSERSTNVRSPGAPRSDVKPARRSLLSQSGSDGSASSLIPRGTTQVRKSTSNSPSKPGEQCETPEWKRRLLQGAVGYDEQVDLFSPMGLEKMFARPSAGTISGASRKSKQMSAFTQRRVEPPSSPPVFTQTRENTIADGLPTHSELGLVEESREELNSDDDQRVRHTPERELRPPPEGDRRSELDNKSISGSGDSSGFSPVFISKHQDAKGSIKYAALDMSKNEVEEQLQRHRESLQQSIQSRHPNPPVLHVEELPSESLDSLPDDLPTGTPEALPLSNFVNVRRGGLSAEGSFRRRPLSPSPLSRLPVGDDGSAEDDSAQHSDMPTSQSESTIEATEYDIRPPAPTPPATRPPRHVEEATSQGETTSHGAPTLLESRSSREPHSTKILQDTNVHPCSLSDETVITNPQVAEEAVARDEVELTQREDGCRRASSRNRFGSGQLDDYTFPEPNISSTPPSEQEVDTGQVRSRSPSPSQMPPGAKEPLRFRVGSGSSDVYDTFKHRRKISRLSNRSSSLTVSKRSANNTRKGVASLEPPTITVGTESVSFASEGKRPLTPFYDPTPKRRRTLVFAAEEEVIPPRSTVSAHETHDRMQSVVGRKRKDALHSNNNNQADPDTLARRHILRPRNPTPSQRRQEQIEREVIDATQDYLASSPRLHSIREHLRPPPADLYGNDPEASILVEEEQARAVAEEVAAFTVRVAGSRKDDSRKRSVTTQDFLDEAMKIMEFIRTKRPTSALSSLEESDEDRHNEESLHRDGTTELPSPTAHNGWRQRDVAQLDSSVVNHLRQFEDNDDPFVASSWSIHEGHRQAQFTSVSEDVPESDPPGIRIIEGSKSEKSQPRGDPADEHPSKGSSLPSHKSYPSVDSSLGRTTMTSASRKSEKVATIAPSNVAHLIGKDVNGMHFDQAKQVWVRSKSRSPTKEEVQRDVSGMTGSDEDPFGEIPDLTVDEEAEMEMVSASPSRPVTATSAQWVDKQFRASQAERKLHAVEAAGKQRTPSLSNEVAPEEVDPAAASTAAPMPTMQNLAGEISNAGNDPDVGTADESMSAPSPRDQADHEYSIQEGRSSPTRESGAKRVGHVRVSVSSPVPRGPPESESLRRKPSTAYRNRRLPALPSQHETSQLLAKQALEQVHEHHEISIIDYGGDRRKVNFSVSLAAPLVVTEATDQSLVVPTSSPVRLDSTYATFCLSELDDFSLHQADEFQQPARQIVRKTSSDLVHVEENRFQSGSTALVKALQDVEPQQPFWEDLRQVELPSRNLTSLRPLDVLCEHVEAVDVSDNAITQVVGAPRSVRSLDISNNLLTGLTSWHHLTNLQYLDVSGNDIDNMRALGRLIHLRELKADRNRIDSLEGVMHLDGLLSLSLVDNRVENVDFADCCLVRLETLSLASNRLGDGFGVRNLNSLPSLRRLNLDDNNLVDFAPRSPRACRAVKSISLRRNRLTSIKLDAASWPALRHLCLDDNRLSSFADIWTLALDTLSARRQQPPLGQPVSARVLHDLLQVRFIALSGSHIPAFTLPSDGLPYLARLELSNCGLQQLPQDFGRQAPRLTDLVVNGNNISDVTSLLGCKSLETLMLANNRLSRLRKSVAVFERISKRLTKLDLRGNAVVTGFYDTSSTSAVACVTADETNALAKADATQDKLDKRSPTISKKAVAASRHTEDTKAEAHRYLLPSLNSATDTLYRSRLDPDTAMRRRVYDIMLSNAIPRLAELDGLEFSMKEVQSKDELWLRLEKLGVIKQRDGG